MAELNSIQDTETTGASQNYSLDVFGDAGIKAPFSIDTNRRSIFAEAELLEEANYSNWETFKASGQSAFQDTTIGVINRYNELMDARKTVDNSGMALDNPILTKEEANERYSQYGVHFNSDIRQNEAEIIAARKIREYELAQRIQQNEGTVMSGAASLLGGMAGAMLDPVGIATSFIPVTKLMPALKVLGASGAGRIGIRAIEGAVGNAILEPLPVRMAGIDQRDYTMADSLFNITAGGVFGAGIGGFVEGVRLLGQGEKFNSGLAAAIDFANNRGYDNILEFQKKNTAITSFTYDDLIELPAERLTVAQDGNTTVIRLAEDGPLSRVVGRGADLNSAKINLRKQLGALLDDDSIYSGYRLDDGIYNLFRAIEDSGNLNNISWMPKWLDTLQKKAVKKDISLEEYLAENTNNFTDFTKLVKRAEQSKTMQARFGELSGEALDDAIEHGAEFIRAHAMLSEAIAANPKTKIDYKTFIGDLRESTSAQKQRFDEVSVMMDNIKRMQEQAEGIKKQLDTTEQIADRDNLTQQLNDLTASIKAHENDLTLLSKDMDESLWKYDADNIEILEAMRKRLEEDPRTFSDVKEQLQKQVADDSGKTWDTADSILDDLSVDETELGDAAKIASLQEETEILISDIKQVTKFKTITKEELAVLGIDSNGYSVEMKRADNKIKHMEEFSKAADDYAACRRTEGI